MGVESDVMVGTSLVDMYAKCGDIFGSRKVFDNMPKRNVVTWNAMIGGYMASGDTKPANLLFEKMPMRSAITWIEMIDGFAKSGDTVTARQLFDRVPLEMRNVVTWTVMVDGYASNGEMEAAKEAAKAVFDRIPDRNLVNWNSLISGLAQNGFCEEAMDLFTKMQTEGFVPDEVTLSSVLSACAQLGLLDVGKEIHQMIVHKGIKLNQFILNGLVDMYAKCGDLSNARLNFEKITKRSDSCWNTMISSYAIHGQCKEALELFGRMEASSEKPNGITFLSVLSACAHGGFVEEGLEIFSKLKKYGLTASIRHYGCVIDLLGRSGRLREAYDLIKSMPVKPNDTVWGALLGACRVHSDMDLADRVLEEVGRDSDTGSGNDSHYVLLSNIYAASDNWEKAERMKRFMSDKGFQKVPGYSSFMLDGPEMSFCAGIT
ncbi:pentatricopeptide repeat (PPR-like) superfamily protein [Actinidia rufa]|uniref:Pentatricopeptide repeat (PPR-like) superfamily protein n=1 Tax=Actinidia rufa TaxID=165716 RepID=A0A7J0DLE1_9ERIC|nr:pentatricopeptide repeat (PPR-like) superfamily protein [Actinidia rufa]